MWTAAARGRVSRRAGGVRQVDAPPGDQFDLFAGTSTGAIVAFVRDRRAVAVLQRYDDL